MTPQKQKYRHDPQNGIYGDCSRAALASLLDMPVDTVPHFFEDGVKAPEADRRRDEFLASLGMATFTANYSCPLETLLEFMDVYNRGRHYILVGTSKNGCLHEVVCCGGAIAWDPAIDESGIVGPDPFGLYWTTVVVKK